MTEKTCEKCKMKTIHDPSSAAKECPFCGHIYGTDPIMNPISETDGDDTGTPEIQDESEIQESVPDTETGSGGDFGGGGATGEF